MHFSQTWYGNRYYCTLHDDTALIDLDLAPRSQEDKKAKSSVHSISQSLNGIWCTVQTCWCNEPHTHYISFIQYSRERTLLI